MPMFSKPKILAQTGQYAFPKSKAATKGKAGVGKAKPITKSGTSSSLDSDIEALQGSRKGKQLISNVGRASSAPRSMPTSPAISAAGGSPSLGPALSGSEKVLERKKGQRISIIHELAAQDQTYEYLESKWTGTPEEFKSTLRKVADFDEGKQRWKMVKTYWKELDVWNYDYDTQEMRQQAIDNAVRQFDKMRLSTTQPQWEKLLPKEERGKGKTLSKLQANLTRGPGATVQRAAPQIKVQKPDDGAESSRDDDSKSVSMARSASNPLPTKKKLSDREAQQKRLLSRKTGTTTKATSPTKGKAPGGKVNGGKVLSQEYVVDSDSDSSENQALAVKPKPARPTNGAAPASSAPTTAARNGTPATSKPKSVKPKEPVKTARTAAAVAAAATTKATAKRRRDEEDDDSSSSGTPLSKRLKQKPIKSKETAPPVTVKQRHPDSSQNSRGSSNGVSYKSKNTSPTKSSPLASSPPTNASDLDQPPPEDTIAARPIINRKRPAVEREQKEPRPKKQQRATMASELPSEVFQKARKFKMFYQKYEDLHYEITALEDPPQSKVMDLLEMRERLQSMKSEIYRECSTDRE